MDAELRKMCQSILNEEPQEKVNIAVHALNDFIEGLKGLGCNDEEITNLIIHLVRILVSADGKCSGAEYSFFRAVTGIDMDIDTFYDMTNGGLDDDYVNEFANLMKKADSKTRTSMVLFAVTFLASDHTLTVAEQDLIDKLLA